MKLENQPDNSKEALTNIQFDQWIGFKDIDTQKA